MQAVYFDMYSVQHISYRIFFLSIWILFYYQYSEYNTRPVVVPGGAGGAMASPDFARSVNPISTKGDRLCPPNNTGTPGFSDLPTALSIIVKI